jgi:hypothetical protein
MDAVRIEHLFAGPLGIRMGQRGKSNDADGVRTANLKYLVQAVQSAIKKLKERAEKLPDDDSILIRARLGDLAMTIDSIKAQESDVKGSTCFHFWSLFAVSLDQIHMDLKDRDA